MSSIVTQWPIIYDGIQLIFNLNELININITNIFPPKIFFPDETLLSVLKEIWPVHSALCKNVPFVTKFLCASYCNNLGSFLYHMIKF